MDDVFDINATDVHSELEVASRDWERRAAEIHSAGVREGYFTRSNAVLQKEFEIGVDQGFALAFELAVLRGRLSVKLYYSVGELKIKIENLVKLINYKEEQLISLGSLERDSTYQQIICEAENILNS
ncbi:unnamed protein product [Heterobilharzia americana]|nr:unnamed protein product [Heterobilharzia americana]